MCKRGFGQFVVLHSQLAKRSQGSGFRSQRRRKAVVDQAQLVVPALQIQFMYPFISFSSFCSSFRSRKPARDSTLSFSFANSLCGRRLFVHQARNTENGGKHGKIFLPLLKVLSCCKLTSWFDSLQNLLHWMPNCQGVGLDRIRGEGSLKTHRWTWCLKILFSELHLRVID